MWHRLGCLALASQCRQDAGGTPGGAGLDARFLSASAGRMLAVHGAKMPAVRFVIRQTDWRRAGDGPKRQLPLTRPRLSLFNTVAGRFAHESRPFSLKGMRQWAVNLEAHVLLYLYDRYVYQIIHSSQVTISMPVLSPEFIMSHSRIDFYHRRGGGASLKMQNFNYFFT